MCGVVVCGTLKNTVCPLRANGTRSCICFQRSDTSHKAHINLFNFFVILVVWAGASVWTEFSNLADQVGFVHFLLHRTGAKSCPFKVRKRTVFEDPKFEEEAGA